ncbi:MAG: ATP-binding cassette domain-containing protein [Actinomycetota bacterium]|nr:ATP-binding cassette domain-containing protein [Actinomycetota bacterium]
MAAAAIDARDVFRVYSTPEGDSAALQGLDLSVGEGEVVVVLGPSGSGKSTLLRLLAGHDRPSAGTVRVFGVDLGNLSGRGLARYRAHVLGYVDQHYSRSLDPDLSARQLVGLQLALAGISTRARNRRADELLERVGLGGRRDAKPRELSGGEQQRIAVCAALAHRPKLLLADEPTGELDAATARRVYDLLGELAREHGCTTVVVSHDLDSISIADRVVRIRDGRVSGAIAAGSREEAIVVGRGGWLRLPEELLARAGIGTLASARIANREIVVSPAAHPDPAARADEGGSGAGDLPALSTAGRRPSGRVAEIRGATKAFGAGAQRRTVFDGLDATFDGGKFVVVTGPSGSGKTTLLHLLAGLDDPDEGEVIVCGKSLGSLDRSSRAGFRRENLALVRQHADLVPFLSSRENVELALAIRGVSDPEAPERAVAALEAVGLRARVHQRVSRLSAGERQRVSVARALASSPVLLLADEPTARLDEANAVALASLFSRLATEVALAVVCATHDPLLIEQADDEFPMPGAPRTRAISDAGGLARSAAASRGG